jgi:hypothetical protein
LRCTRRSREAAPRAIRRGDLAPARSLRRGRGDLLEECREKFRTYEQAAREDTEDAYGDYADVIETATEALADMRDRFARTLDEDAAEAYEDAFNRAVRKRWPELGLEIENR